MELWESSADAWLARVERDPNRTHLLDPIMLELCGEGFNRLALDVGCAEGRFSRMLASKGWRSIGLDPVPKFVSLAAQAETTVVRGTGERLPFQNERFALVVSYLSLLDIPDARTAVREMARVLEPKGRLVVANCTPFFTPILDPWMRDVDGNKLHLRLDDYVREHPLRVSWCGIDIVNYHRSMKDTMQSFLACGLRLTHFDEPQPSDETIDQFPGLADYRRVPNMLTMVWAKD